MRLKLKMKLKLVKNKVQAEYEPKIKWNQIKGGITLRAGETFFALNPVIFKLWT